jgi:hypothetical protein
VRRAKRVKRAVIFAPLKVALGQLWGFTFSDTAYLYSASAVVHTVALYSIGLVAR